MAFEDAEDAVYPVVFGQIVLVVPELRFKVVEIVLGNFESVAGSDDCFGLGRI